MAKLKAPLFSFQAIGKLAKHFSLAKRHLQSIIEETPIPTDAKSPYDGIQLVPEPVLEA